MENRRPQSHIDNVAFDAASLSRESASNLRKRVGDEAARMAARRRSCLSLGKHVASAMKSVCDCKFVVRRGVVLEHVPQTSDDLGGLPRGFSVRSIRRQPVRPDRIRDKVNEP